MFSTNAPGETTAAGVREEILLVRPDHLDDLLLTTPALHALRVGLPEACISILVGSWSAPLLRGNPDPDEVIVCDLPWLARTGRASWRETVATLRRVRAPWSCR